MTHKVGILITELGDKVGLSGREEALMEQITRRQSEVECFLEGVSSFSAL